MNDSFYINKTRDWIKEFIIERNICPFAEAEFLKKKIGFKVLEISKSFDQVLQSEIDSFAEEEWNNWSTYFYIIPFLKDYDVFLEVFYLAEDLIDKKEDFPMRLVAFHPDHRYQGTDENDTVNFANRSPFPLIQILKKEHLDLLKLSEEDKAEILDRNEKLFSHIGYDNLVKALDEFRR